MKVSLDKSVIRGRVVAPSSKSYTIRGLMCAALAPGESQLISPLGSDDTAAAIEVLNKIGVPVRWGKNGWQVDGGNFHEATADLFCRESATTLRLMTAIAALVPGQCRLTSAPSLARRPMEPLLQALRQLGVDCYQQENEGITVRGGGLRGGLTEVAGNISSQFVSALLLVAPFADEDVTIRLTTPLESQPYILMTREYLEKFGIKVQSSADLWEFEIARQSYQPAKLTIEGDWSSASYLLALGAVGGEVEVENLNTASLQGDKIILDLLRDMGAAITTGQNSVRVSRSGLKAIKADLSDSIDLLPTVAVLAASADGTSHFSGIARARLKESNRVAAVQEGLERLGIPVTEEPDRLSITGSPARSATIDSHGDHRIAMAFSLLGVSRGGTVINGAECVAKSYPGFWDTLKCLGGKVKIDGK